MWKGKGVIILCCVIAVAGIACLIAGIVLIKKPIGCDDKRPSKKMKCAYSHEAERVGLAEFFQKVQDAYFEVHPEYISSKPGTTAKQIRDHYVPYDPSPERLKRITEKSVELLRELQGKTIDKHNLKPRERKGLAQMFHFLKSTFGSPTAVNYYSGDFLLGPSMFCREPFCYVMPNIINTINQFKLFTVEDVDNLLKKIELVNHTFTQYKANLIYGVGAGMVRSTQPCQVGVDSLLARLGYKDEQPIDIAQGFIGKVITITAGISPENQQKWVDKSGKSVNDSIYNHVLEYVGKPLYELVTYLKTTYLYHCVPSDVSSGLATLPISHIYLNKTKTAEKTYPFLPDGTPLNGSRAYQTHILPFYTTTSISPDEVNRLGHEMVAKLYSQILELAREYTNKTNNDTATDAFKQKLNASSMYYANSKDIPEIESNGTAFVRCKSVQGAKKHCPIRWGIIQRWFDDVNKIMSSLDGETVNLFHFVGPMHTTPNCPVQPKPNFNQNMGVPSYRPSSRTCAYTASYFIPFFLTRPGPKFTQLSVNSHEARPGHHTQVQGSIEHFRDSCGGVIGWVDGITWYTAFAEGWGLYAEDPLIGSDTDVYKDKPLQKYGMLRGQLWRALRLVVDTGLHFKKMPRQEALKYFKDYIWEENDVVEKEITRYQTTPGQATTYTIGQLHLIKLRAHARKELGAKFNLKDFHYYLLKDGSAPLDFLTESIEDYIRCTKDNKGSGCEYVLPTEGDSDTVTMDTVTMDNGVEFENAMMERYY